MCVCVCVCVCVRACMGVFIHVQDSWEFVLTVVVFFSLQWAVRSSLEKEHIKEYNIIVIVAVV